MTANDERELSDQVRDLFQTKPFTYSLDLASAKKIAGFILQRERRVAERCAKILCDGCSRNLPPRPGIPMTHIEENGSYYPCEAEAIRAGGEEPNGSTHCAACGEALGDDQVKHKASLYHPACLQKDEHGTRS